MARPKNRTVFEDFEDFENKQRRLAQQSLERRFRELEREATPKPKRRPRPKRRR